MKIYASLVALLFVAACGGKSKPKPEPKPLVPDETGEDVEPQEDTEAEEETPPEPPPPQVWHAKADLAAVKGSKMKPATVTFTQTEGDNTGVSAELDGLKAGAYHLVIHEAAACGKNATKAGAIWETTASEKIDMSASKGSPVTVDEALEVMLDGENTIVGHTLVLHADKKGKPGKAVACGSIVSDESDDEPAADPE